MSITATIMVAIALSMTIQFRLFGIRFALDRSAIIFIPLFFLYLLFFLQVLKDEKQRSSLHLLMAWFLSVSLGLLLLHQLSCINVNHNFLWQYDAGTKDVMNLIAAFGPGESRENYFKTVGISERFEPAANYYRLRYGMDWIPPFNRCGPLGVFNYYYLDKSDQGLVEKLGLKVLKVFPASGALIAVYPIKVIVSTH